MLNNHFLKAQKVNTNSCNSELYTTSIKNLEQELADQVKICQRVEVDVELRLKQAIDQLLGNKPDPVEVIPQLPLIKPVPGLDFDTVRFTDKVCSTNNQA